MTHERQVGVRSGHGERRIRSPENIMKSAWGVRRFVHEQNVITTIGQGQRTQVGNLVVRQPILGPGNRLCGHIVEIDRVNSGLKPPNRGCPHTRLSLGCI